MNRFSCRSLSVLALVSCFACSVQAYDLGVRGPSFPIKEEGFLVMIKRKLESVDLEREQERMRNIAKDKVENPPPVRTVKPATVGREFLWDPTYILDKDAVLPCGKVLRKAGTKVNPLEHMELERRLFFVDAREENQLKWLKEQLAAGGLEEASSIESRVILVGGSVFKTQEQLGIQVFFDQSGELTTRFGIKASPAVLVQEGKQLKIKEYYLER